MGPPGKTLVAFVVGSSQCPFLYQTRTLFRPEHLRRRSKSTATSSTPKQRPHNQANNGEALRGLPEAPSFLKSKAAQVASSKPKAKSTVTPAEQAAFDSIWALFEKPSVSTAKSRATSTDHTDTDYKNILELFSSLPKESDETFKDGLDGGFIDRDISPPPEHTPMMKDPAKGSHDFNTKAPSQTQFRLNRESAMAEIRGFLKDTASSPDLASSKSTDNIQSGALRIVEDVADSLSTALSSENPRPDIAMWKVAEGKIFPLMQLLRPSTPSLSSPPPPRTGSPQTLSEPDQQTPHLQPRQLHPLIPSDVPLLPLLSQTYPSLTLLILRLYATHHPTSPYALALLPTLKSLGPTSYVLGAHTHFYNSLLSLYWRIYSDLRGMNTLLAEMEANGVEFDVGTCEAIKGVGEDRKRDMDGHGERGESWWRRREQLVWWQRVGVEWKEALTRRLEEKGMLTGEVMREEMSRSRFDADEEQPEYVVTL